MKLNIQKASLLSLSLLVVNIANAQSTFDTLKAQVDIACPIIWEDLGAAISENQPADVWQGDATDRSIWVNNYATQNGVSVGDADVVAGNLAAVASECAAARTALLDELIQKTPADVTLALNSASNGGDAGDYLNGAWMVGDVRVTGRAAAAPGWVFLAGQTIGDVGSSADLAGAHYFGLFELAKTWHPNTGTESWQAGDTVTLPDMRGRAIVGADNLGGTSADTMTNSSADTVGGVYGAESVVLSEAQLPSHSHTMNGSGSHNHTMGNDTHRHGLSAGTTNDGAGSAAYLGNTRRETGSANVDYWHSVDNDTHKHTLTSAPNHTHTINSAGSSAAVTMTQPSITFNVEMKY